MHALKKRVHDTIKYTAILYFAYSVYIIACRGSAQSPLG